MDIWDASSLKRKLKQARDWRGVSAKELAKSANVGIDAYYKWERPEENLPSHEKLATLANLLELDIRYFYKPSMTLEEADLNQHPQGEALERLVRDIEDMKSKIVPDAKFDPLAHAVKTKKPLRELVETLTKLDESALLEARGLIHGYLFGQEKKAEREAEEKGRQNAG